MTEIGIAHILSESDIQPYEHHLNHAKIISSWDNDSYQRGEKIYRVHCFQCHGDQHQPGSLPNSRQFWRDEFKGGNDPFSLYQTITKGLGQMPPQVQLVAQQKYDVIHFLREYFIKSQNPKTYFTVSEQWLESLPEGDTLGPDPKPYHPWMDMDYGNWLIHCYEIADDGDPPKVISGGRSPLPNEDYSKVNFAYKGIAMRLDKGPGGVAEGKAFAVFDHDLLRLAGAWTGEGFIDWEDILLDDQHNVYPRTVGKLQATNPITPGWANPLTGSFEDPRIRGLDGRPFGPLPKEWAHYQGLYKYNDQTIIQYSVDQAVVLERFDLDSIDGMPIFSRIINISENNRPLKMRVLPAKYPVKLISGSATLTIEEDYHVLNIPANQTSKARILFGKNSFDISGYIKFQEIPDLSLLTKGGEKIKLEEIFSSIVEAKGSSSFDVDIFTLPLNNPWKSRVRPTGIDFINDGKDALVCTIDGEVWKINNIINREQPVSWQRIATGLFQPLGIKYHDEKIYVGCRDQIVRLHDFNGDQEIDFYESFNNDHQVTEHFHEFAMGLQTDEEGNFYYAKSGRHARTSLVPQHGTLIKVSADGQNSTILANGFRAANGVCLNPDGSFFVTDQEGYWNPMNRINRVVPGGFYGNMWGYGAPEDSSDQAMEMPLCWIDSKYDRSPAELLWVESDRWGPLSNKLLSLSYGNGKIFLVLTQQVDKIHQGAFFELPVPQFPTGLIRGRFNSQDGQLYTCGMSAWATNQMLQTGGLYRVRHNIDKEMNVPVELSFLTNQIQLRFTDALDAKSVSEINNYEINTWQLKRSRKYGSDRYDLKKLEIDRALLNNDQKTIILDVEDLQPTWVIEILYNLKTAGQKEITGAMQGTVYLLEKRSI